MIETLLFYAAWAALATAVISSIVITQGAIRQLLQDSAEPPPSSPEEAESIAPPIVERHV
jgi:hypothetical protein